MQVALPPQLPLPNLDVREKKRQQAKAKARARGEEEEEEVSSRRFGLLRARHAVHGCLVLMGAPQVYEPTYEIGTSIGTMAAAAMLVGEGSSNELHAAAYHGLVDQLIKVDRSPAATAKVNARDS